MSWALAARVGLRVGLRLWRAGDGKNRSRQRSLPIFAVAPPPELHYELLGFDELRQKFGPELVEKALAMALNKASLKARTEASRKVREVYNIKAGDISRTARVRRVEAGGSGVAWLLEHTGGRIGLEKFGMRQIRVASARGTRLGVSVQVKKAGGRKRVKGAFAHSNTVFKREGNDRLPIKRKTSLAIPQAVSNHMVMAAVLGKIRSDCDIEFDRAMRVTLDRVMGK